MNRLKIYSFLALLICFGFTKRMELKLAEPCVTKKEKQLYELIMKYRKQKGLPSIPLSAAMTKVAQVHAQDLSQEAPYKKEGCNLHSWSNKGSWTACCYDDRHSNPECMWNKPREISGFDANGFEISYGSESETFVVDAEKALNSWKESKGHNMVMINKGTWKDFQWKSIGVGVYKNFACVWFATEADTKRIVKVCD